MTDIKTPSAAAPKLFAEIYQLSASMLDSAIQRATRFAATALFNKLNKTESWLQADFSLTINLLESNHEWFGQRVCSGVLKRLKEAHEQGLKTLSEQQLSRNTSQLSLVSKDDFEDWLVANMAIKTLERELGFELLSVSQILSSLAGKHFDNKGCKLGPGSIITELKAAIDTMELPQSPQTIIYKAIAHSLINDLKDLYGRIKLLADKRGLVYTAETQVKMPQVKSPIPGAVGALGRISSSSSSTASSDRVIKAELEPPVLLNQVEESVPECLNLDEELGLKQEPASLKTLNTLSRLQASSASGGHLRQSSAIQSGSNPAQRAQQDKAPPVAHNAKVYDPMQLVSVISQLQQLHGNTSSHEQKSLRHWLDAGLSSSPSMTKSIGAQQSEIIDVTDRFFQVIVEKIGVSGLLKNWLKKLKLTILKIVLRDESFFSDVAHPARQMLNKLAKLVASDRSGNKRLEKLLDQYIDRVVADYDDDPHTVERVVQELDVLLERQALAYQRNSERIARTYQGKQKIAEARHLVIADLDKLLGGTFVPLILMELLDKAGWREHLATVVVREGHQSAAYKEAFNIVEQLMIWLGTDADNVDKWAIELEMELEAASLLEAVAKELGTVNAPGHDAVLKRLESCLFDGVEPLLVKLEKYLWPYDKTEKDLEELRPLEGRKDLRSHWQKRIMSMKIGDWIELKNQAGKTRCLRLAWSGSESFRFVFVDSQGMKDEDIFLDDLVELFKTNKAAFLDHDEVPLVDQGLHQMVQSVYEELSSQASCDQLTGLLSRQAFERALGQTIAGAVSRQTEAFLLYIDLDKFSLINTNYGHQAGDSLLKHVAQIIRKKGPEHAFCGRLGGNEFGIIVPDCSNDSAISLAKAIRTQVETDAYPWEGHQITTSVSIGVVAIDLQTDGYDSVLRKAGLACDSAKAQGQNRFVLYQEQDKDQQRRDEILQWALRLDESLDDFLTLRCQEIRPIMQLGAATRASHYEILLGVRHEGQVLPPGPLIEAAEHFGRMAKVDRWVFHNVLRWMEANEDFVASADGFSINLSGNSLSDDKFLDFVLGELAATNVSPKMICFEITETAAITNLAEATEFIRILKQTGCRFSLDDFGSGLSSYAYIQKLPVDYIKIDGVFIRNLVHSNQDQALVKSINELAHFMGIKTVAEYVESHEILEVLRRIGVDHSQGFGIKKPILLANLTQA